MAFAGKICKAKVILPRNFDLETHKRQYPPCSYGFERVPFKDYKALYILYLLSVIPSRNSDIITEDGFIPIHTPTLQNHMRDYKLVRGNPQYGENRFVDNGDGTVSDLATGLMWQQNDDGQRYDWPQALQYADTLTLAGHTDWYLPNAKELQSLVDYERAGREPGAPAISPLFGCTKHTLCDGLEDYGYYWSSTSHLDGPQPGSSAVYVCFGRAWGRNPRTGELTDVHGAGAQRSDPKTGTEDDYPRFFGPQRDLQCLFNAVRCVRRIDSENLDQ